MRLSRMHGCWRLRRSASSCCLRETSFLEAAPHGAVKEQLAQTEVYVKKLAEHYPGSHLFVSTIDVRQERIRERDGADFSLRASAAWDAADASCGEENDGVHRLELRDFIENYGSKSFYSEKFWYMGSIPYEMQSAARAGGRDRTHDKQIKGCAQKGACS